MVSRQIYASNVDSALDPLVLGGFREYMYESGHLKVGRISARQRFQLEQQRPLRQHSCHRYRLLDCRVENEA